MASTRQGDSAWKLWKDMRLAAAAKYLHRRQCPACEQRSLKPFRFPSGVWGFRCRLCGEGHVVSDWASRGHVVWDKRITGDSLCTYLDNDEEIIE